jgi:hypothetical protein
MISASIVFCNDRAQPERCAIGENRESVIFASGTMVYVKSILVGLGIAILSLVLLAAIAVVINLPQGKITGVGAIAVPASGILIVGLTMFAVGFAWMFRRSTRKSR